MTIFGGVFVSKSTELLDLMDPSEAETTTADRVEIEPLINGLLGICSLFVVYLLSACWYTHSMKENIVKLAAEILEYYKETNSEASDNVCGERRVHFQTECTPSGDQRRQVNELAVLGLQEIDPLRVNT